MVFNRVTIRHGLAFAVGVVLSACGDGSPAGGNSAASSDCPPTPKSGLSAMQRAGGMENFEKYSKWQTELPLKSCAVALASYIPDLPPGYGLPPNVRPPLMTNGHVYLKYVKIPENITGDALEMFNFAQQPQFEFEIAQLSPEDVNKFKQWFINNPDSIKTLNTEGRAFQATGGGGWYMPGHKLSGGIGTILDNNILIKFSMPKMYADDAVTQPIMQMFHEIAVKNGQ